jgi:hypothetical protein
MAIQINDNIYIRAGKPIDYKFGPFLSIQEANESILIEERYSGLIFGIFTNPSDIPNSDIVYYCYYGGLTDTDIRELIFDSDKNFVYIQNSPSNTWNITHNLEKYPSVSILDTANNIVEGDINHINENQLILTFSAPFSGKASLN